MTEVETAEPGAVEPEPSDAFQVLGNEVRMAVLRALLSTDDEGGAVPGSMSFSELFEASPATESAGFAYHLRQLTDHYLRKTDDGYALTYAGLKIARAIEAGTYTESVDTDPVALDEPCPFCEATSMEARGADNYLSVACTDCERSVLTLPFPPGGYRAHEDDMPEAFDRQHRYRLSLMADGHCPECGGTVETESVRASDRVALPDDTERVQLRLDCAGCGYRLRCPPTLAVLEHPAVVSFYHEHDLDVRARPVWNVGDEWRETLLSTNPWVVRVSTRLDGETLALFLDETGTVREVTREEA